MADMEKQDARRAQQLEEVEANQAGIRDSVSKTPDMLREADNMRRRHRKECKDDDN